MFIIYINFKKGYPIIVHIESQLEDWTENYPHCIWEIHVLSLLACMSYCQSLHLRNIGYPSLYVMLSVTYITVPVKYTVQQMRHALVYFHLNVVKKEIKIGMNIRFHFSICQIYLSFPGFFYTSFFCKFCFLLYPPWINWWHIGLALQIRDTAFLGTIIKTELPLQ